MYLCATIPIARQDIPTPIIDCESRRRFLNNIFSSQSVNRNQAIAASLTPATVTATAKRSQLQMSLT